MGAAIVSAPRDAVAVVSGVGIYDMLRVELTPQRRVQRDRVRHGEGRSAGSERCHAYSPFHNVKDGTLYPAVLFTTGAIDPRVDAYHSRKMTARLQAATSSDQPILLRMESGGHGIGQSLDQLVGLVTDYYTFLFDRLQVLYRAS